jgi:hypothetical protein
VLWTRVCAGL